MPPDLSGKTIGALKSPSVVLPVLAVLIAVASILAYRNRKRIWSALVQCWEGTLAGSRAIGERAWALMDYKIWLAALAAAWSWIRAACLRMGESLGKAWACLAACCGAVPKSPVVLAALAAASWCGAGLKIAWDFLAARLVEASQFVLQCAIGAWNATVVPCSAWLCGGIKRGVASASSGCLAWAVDDDPEAANPPLLHVLATRSDHKAAATAQQGDGDSSSDESDDESSDESPAAAQKASKELPPPAPLPPPADDVPRPNNTEESDSSSSSGDEDDDSSTDDSSTDKKKQEGNKEEEEQQMCRLM